jgi:hypothetical protein
MDRTNHVFGRYTTFDEAYPTLSDAVIDYKQYMFGSSAADSENLPEHYSIRNGGGVIDCKNPACVGGGFTIDRAINDVDASDKPKTMRCSGHENMGRGQTRSCLSRIRYKVRLISRTEVGTES